MDCLGWRVGYPQAEGEAFQMWCDDVPTWRLAFLLIFEKVFVSQCWQQTTCSEGFNLLSVVYIQCFPITHWANRRKHQGPCLRAELLLVNCIPVSLVFSEWARFYCHFLCCRNITPFGMQVQYALDPALMWPQEAVTSRGSHVNQRAAAVTHWIWEICRARGENSNFQHFNNFRHFFSSVIKVK